MGWFAEQRNRVWFVITVLVIAWWTGVARADPPPEKAAPPANSWAAELEALGSWVSKHHGATCTERCFALSRLRLTGSVLSGSLKFELEGHLLADGPVPVPLFGAPTHVRIEQATENGKPAPIGFEKDHYFFAATSRHFVLKGTLALDEDRALFIPGPLNTLETDLSDGRCVEGARLSGLATTTIHFDRAVSTQPAAEPTVFQLSRAVRVGREINFEYKLVMRSGSDLGVARLPLAFGERVLDVAGAGGSRVDGNDLVLPTSGHSADIKISGTLGQVASFKPDDRSTYEWWLFESDAEHRVTVKGDARQLDSAESPIARTLPTSRLYMVQRGQHVEVTVQTLSSVDVLAAVVRSHDRTVVLTRRGDLVADETLGYENNGIDYLFLNPDGRPIFLATDGKSERIMHREKGAEEVMVPLRTGSHTTRVQSLGQASIAGLGGRLEIPLSSYPLTASRVGVRLGLPALIYPIAFLGGDRPQFCLDEGDAVAMAASVVLALVLLRGLGRKVLGALAIGGLWFASPALFVAIYGLTLLGGLFWLLGRFLSGKKFVLAVLALAMAGGFCLLVAIVGTSLKRSEAPREYEAAMAAAPSMAEASRDESVPAGQAAQKAEGAMGGSRGRAKTGNFMAQDAAGGVLEGVTPVALTLPAYERSVYASRELVTRERPFHPVLFYATAGAAWPLGLAWLACVGALFVLYRPTLRALLSRIRARLAQGSAARVAAEPAPTPPNPEA